VPPRLHIVRSSDSRNRCPSCAEFWGFCCSTCFGLGDRQVFIIRFSTQVAIWYFFRFENLSGASSASRRVIDVLNRQRIQPRSKVS